MRFWIETGLAVLCGFLGLLTLVWRDWLEALSGFDLDHHNGSLEWAIVVALLAVSVALGRLARAERRRTVSSGSASA